MSNPKCAERNEDFENFLRYDLDNLNLEELKDAADAVEVKKRKKKRKILLHGEDYYFCIFFELFQTNKVKDQPVSKKFVQNIKSILSNEIHIHRLHISGDIVGCSQSYCNLRVRENKKKSV